ncbi:MAG TPA: pyruvate formate lyase family protein, partial [Candidatus Hydrogenedentes bacterium]|nr:pyruvate formate lyase family protein [Candidatus Hydrogenedentota bacterium]
KYEFPPEVFELGRQARELGAGGTSHGHTCLDLAIGLKLGWSGILQKIDRNIAKYERLHNESKLSFLRGARYCYTAVIDWIGQYAALAEKMAAEASTAAEKERLEKIAATCSSLAKNAPQTYHEAVQFIQFAVRPEEDAEAIAAYLKALTPVPSPRLEKGALSPSAQRGEILFKQAHCAECHPAPLYTDLKLHTLGTTRGMDEGKSVDTPTLIEVWRTAPYLHDGRAATLHELFTIHNSGDRHGKTSSLNEEELADLISYVESL